MKIRLFSTAALAMAIAIPVQAATVFIPEGSGDSILIVKADTGEVLKRLPDLEAVHGLSGAPGVKYLVAGSYTEIEREDVAQLTKPETVSTDEHEAHHAKRDDTAMPADAGLSLLTVLDAATGDVVRRIEVPGAVHHTAVSPDGKYAVATHPSDDGISVIDLTTLTYRGFIRTGPMPNYALFGDGSGKVFVSNAGNGTIGEVDLARGYVIRNIPVGEAPEHMVIDADAATIYAADSDAGIAFEISLTDGAVARTFEIGGELHGIDLSDDRKTLFITGKSEDKLVAIDLASGERRVSTLAPAPYHLTTIPGTGTLFVSSRDEPKVWIVDQMSLEPIGDFAVEGEGHQMVALP